MKKFAKEFKEFIAKGNMVDMAVGIIIGTAFTGIVSGFIDNVINPFIAVFTGGVNLEELWMVPIGEIGTEQVTYIKFGAFLSNVLQFLIVALVLFFILKGINKMRDVAARKKQNAEEETPTTKICPFCKSEIDIEASRCPHCTSVLEEKALTKEEA